MDSSNVKADYIRNFIVQNDLWTLPSKTLSKKIVAENPEMFGEYNEANIEKCRNSVRYVRYSIGGKEKHEPSREFAERFHGYFEPENNDYTPFVIPNEITKIGIINDVHIPFQNKMNLKLALEYLQKKEINGLLLNGDILDCYKASKFMQDPRNRNINEEFIMLREFIDTLNSMFNCPIYYKLGNHEERIESMVLRSVPELVHFVTFENCLADGGNFDFNEYKLTIIKDRRIVKFTDNLNIIHGHEYRAGSMFNPVGIARWLYTKAKSNAACGHAHKSDSFSARDIGQKTTTTWAIGCLCDTNPKYMPLNDWQSGFAYVRRTETDNFKFFNAIIENGEIL